MRPGKGGSGRRELAENRPGEAHRRRTAVGNFAHRVDTRGPVVEAGQAGKGAVWRCRSRRGSQPGVRRGADPGGGLRVGPGVIVQKVGRDGEDEEAQEHGPRGSPPDEAPGHPRADPSHPLRSEYAIVCEAVKF